MVKIAENIKKIYAALFLSMFVLFAGTAECMSEEAPMVVVDDAAGLLMEEEADWLESIALEVADRSGFHVILATCEDAEEKSTQYICERLLNTYAPTKDGISCLIDMDNREIYIATSGEAIFYLTDERIDEILDEAYEAVSDEDYSECLYIMALRAGEFFDEGIPEDVEIYDKDTGISYIYDKETGELAVAPRLPLLDIMLALIAALIVGGIVFGVIVGKYKLVWGNYKYDYHEGGNLKLTREDDRFINQVVTCIHIPKEDGDSSGGGQSSVHSGAGGNTFGGGGRKF